MAMPRGGLLNLTIKDKAVLYSAYMPFVKGGGLFISSKKTYRIGEEIFLLLTLMDEPEPLPVAGTVIWITPLGAQGTRPAGVGIQFNDADDIIKNKIETHLAGSLSSERPTHTM